MFATDVGARPEPARARASFSTTPSRGAARAPVAVLTPPVGSGPILTPMRRPPLAVATALVIAALALATRAEASPRERRFFSAKQGVGVDAPNGWTLSEQTGYPEILVVLMHPDGSRISVSAAPTTAPDARALAEQSRRGLEAQHLTIARVAAGARGGVALDAQNAARASALRQLYLVRPTGGGKRQGIVLTLVARAGALASAGPAFEWVVEHLALEPPTGATEEPDAGAPTSGAGRAGHENER